MSVRIARLLAALLWVGCGSSEPHPGPSEPIEAPLPPGVLSGRVRLQFKDEDRPGGPLANAFVYIKQGLEGRTYPLPADPVLLDQVVFQFVPRVFGIRAGQTLKITSQDASQHNVFCQPFNSPGFNKSMFAGEALEAKFNAPEVMVMLQCNIHHIMKAYAGVLDHPFFTVTGRDGAFELKGLPPGRYTLAVWEEIAGNRTTEVELASDRGKRIEFLFK